MKRVLLTLALLAAAAASAAQSQPQPQQPATAAMPATIGRLFFTPSERAQLDLARVQKKPALQAEAQAEPEPQPTPQTVTYGGIVRRSDGKSMLWINNRLVEEKEALAGLNLKGKVRPDGAVTVQVPGTSGSIDVKVGQSIEVQTGKVGEARRPQPEAKAPEAKAPEEATAEAKPAAAQPAAPPAAAAKPAAETAPAPAERKADAGGAVGLKLDLGGRALDSSRK